MKYQNLISTIKNKEHLEVVAKDMVNYDNATEEDIQTLREEWEANHGQQEKVMVRARDEKGHYIKDDPDTPQDEAWVEKPKKKKG